MAVWDEVVGWEGSSFTHCECCGQLRWCLELQVVTTDDEIGAQSFELEPLCEGCFLKRRDEGGQV